MESLATKQSNETESQHIPQRRQSEDMLDASGVWCDVDGTLDNDHEGSEITVPIQTTQVHNLRKYP